MHELKRMYKTLRDVTQLGQCAHAHTHTHTHTQTQTEPDRKRICIHSKDGQNVQTKTLVAVHAHTPLLTRVATERGLNRTGKHHTGFE